MKRVYNRIKAIIGKIQRALVRTIMKGLKVEGQTRGLVVEFAPVKKEACSVIKASIG